MQGRHDGRRTLYLLDFDGTLVKTYPRPELAFLPKARRELLARLNDGHAILAIVTGRSVPDIRERIGLPGVHYAGDFGIEITGPRCRFLHPDAPRGRRLLAAIDRKLAPAIRDVPFAWIEKKRWSRTLHYRRVPPGALRKLQRRLKALRDDPMEGLKWKRGLRCWEISPDIAWDKGNAALMLWLHMGKPHLVAIGDNAADRPMFQVAADKGVALSVGRRRIPPATRRIKNVPGVYRYLSHHLRGARRR